MRVHKCVWHVVCGYVQVGVTVTAMFFGGRYVCLCVHTHMCLWCVLGAEGLLMEGSLSEVPLPGEGGPQAAFLSVEAVLHMQSPDTMTINKRSHIPVPSTWVNPSHSETPHVVTPHLAFKKKKLASKY